MRLATPVLATTILALSACVAVPEIDPATGEPTGEVTYEPDAEQAEEVATVIAPFLPPPFNIILPGLAAISAGVRINKGAKA